jgi:hypothetical protein
MYRLVSITLLITLTLGTVSCTSASRDASQPLDRVLAGAVWLSGGDAPFSVSAFVYHDGTAEFIWDKSRSHRFSHEAIAEVRAILDSSDAGSPLKQGWTYYICCDVPVTTVIVNGRFLGDLPVVPQKGLPQAPLDLIAVLDRLFLEAFGNRYQSWLQERATWDY